MFCIHKVISSLDSLPCPNTASHNSKLATELRRAAISVNVAIILLYIVASFPGLQSQPVKLLRKMTSGDVWRRGTFVDCSASACMHGAISRAFHHVGCDHRPVSSPLVPRPFFRRARKMRSGNETTSSPRSKAHYTRERELATASSVVPNPPPGWSGNKLEKATMMIGEDT